MEKIIQHLLSIFLENPSAKPANGKRLLTIENDNIADLRSNCDPITLNS